MLPNTTLMLDGTRDTQNEDQEYVISANSALRAMDVRVPTDFAYSIRIFWAHSLAAWIEEYLAPTYSGGVTTNNASRSLGSNGMSLNLVDVTHAAHVEVSSGSFTQMQDR